MLPPTRGSYFYLIRHSTRCNAIRLLAVLEKADPQNGCATVMEVATGAITAMANLSCTKSGEYIESYNHAMGNPGTFGSGSIFKLASMLALLEETGWPITKTIDTGHGAIQFYNRWMKDVKKEVMGCLPHKR